MKKVLYAALFLATLSFTSCEKDNTDDSSFNLFSIEDDKKLGAQVAEQIAANPQEYPVLDPSQYTEAYAFINKMRDSILATGKVFYKDQFPWKMHIIHDDNTLNAFATPAGYIYFYTGLIKFLNAEHELAGVMAHEMAHSDRRHTTDQLTKIYGLSILLNVVFGGNPNLIADIAASLVSLKFSRNNEREADEYSVIYLCPTHYKADGAAAFFDQLINQGAGSPPEFLSSHPNPGNRVADIQAKANELNCQGTGTFDQQYAAFKQTLP
jgi:beta-barrel assembly-enhancing protease